MRIQHNIAALNSYRNLTNNNNAVAKNLEKLSSGYKINRAGDDAAGLAISEKMRAQITGLQTAQKNASDGVSLVQTAEGALTEVHSMLNRMVELANQSANGTYDNETDRLQLQKELDQLRGEIDRIADSSNFNGIKLLDGSMDADAVTTTTADSAISAITTNKYAPKGASDAFNASYITNRPEAATTQTNGKFVLSLDDLAIGALDAGDKVTLTVGDATLEYTIQTKGTDNMASVANGFATTGGGKTLTGVTDHTSGNGATGAGSTTAEFDAAMAASTTDGNYIKIDGHIWKMTADTTKNTITFDQVDYMGESGELVTPDYNVKVESDNKDADGKDLMTGTVNWQNQQTVTGKGVGTSHQAQVSVDIDFSKLKDGDRLVAGNKTYVFKVGKDSTTAADATKGETLVDLSNIFKEESDLADAKKQAEAMVKITGDMGLGNTGTGDTWSIGNGGVNDGVGTLTFQSLSTYDGDTNTANKQYIGGNTNNGICDMRTESSVMKQFFSERAESGATVSFELDVTKIKVGDTFTIDGKTFEFTDGEASSSKNVAIDLSSLGVANGLLSSQTGDVTAIMQKAIQGEKDNTGKYTTEPALKLGDGNAKYSVTIDGNKVTLSSNDSTNTASIFENRTPADLKLPTITTNGKSLTLQIGDTSEDFNQLKVNIGDAHVAALGIGDISITTQEDAAKAVDAIKNAINKVSDIRGGLGAVQNRLEHTINNLGVQTENITAAESRIRDVDMAQEMMAYTKNNILVQAAQAMLAQANQVPQGVLQLLQ